MAITKWRTPDVMAITKWSISGLGAATQTACQQRGDDSCTNSLLYDLLRPRAPQAIGNQAQLALKEFDPCENTAIVAEAVFVERGVNLFGQPKWVVAVIFDTGVRVTDVVVAFLKSLS